VEVLERYGKSNGWLDGQPAAITRQVGKGRITYIGAWLDDEELQSAATWMTEIRGVKPALRGVRHGVEVYPRYANDRVVYILVNFSQTEQKISLPTQMEDVLNGGKANSVALPVYGVAVLESRK
jgi:beta-galactosidase